MNSNNALSSLIELYESVRSLLRKAGVSMNGVAYSRQRLEEYAESKGAMGTRKIQEAIMYLQALLTVHEKPFLWAYSQRTPEQWKTYEAMQLTNLNEYKLLAKERRALISAWKVRPAILRRDDIEDPPDPNRKAKKAAKKAARALNKERSGDE